MIEPDLVSRGAVAASPLPSDGVSYAACPEPVIRCFAQHSWHPSCTPPSGAPASEGREQERILQSRMSENRHRRSTPCAKPFGEIGSMLLKAQ